MANAETFDIRYPAVSDLRNRAKKRIPSLSWEYLDSGTGRETAKIRNEEALSEISLVPEVLKGEFKPTLSTTLFGRRFSAPFGISPVGFAGLAWPEADGILARMAGKRMIPHCLSTVASDTPEKCGPLAMGNGWFQLYPPKRSDIQHNLIERAKQAGYQTLVVTVDVPHRSSRERQMRAGVTEKPRITPQTVLSMIAHPAWLAATIRQGRPKFLALEQYVEKKDMATMAQFIGKELFGMQDWNYFKSLRDRWDGPLVIKGVLSCEDAQKAVEAGADAVWVSNHGGRQFDAAPASVDVLKEIADSVGAKVAVIFDGGVRSGTDVLRAIALGADFVFLGRPFMYGICALGAKGADHVYQMLSADLVNNMGQVGAQCPLDVRGLQIRRRLRPR